MGCDKSLRHLSLAVSVHNVMVNPKPPILCFKFFTLVNIEGSV